MGRRNESKTREKLYVCLSKLNGEVSAVFLMHYFGAVHWPFDGVQADERPLARKLAAQMLPLSIGQRYDTAHIDYLTDTLDTCKGLLL